MRKLCLLIALMASLFTHISALADGVETCGVENMPTAIKIMIADSRWSNWEITGWINPRGLQSANACAFAVVNNPPKIPAGTLSAMNTQDIKFIGGKKYDVYSGPGKDYVRAANGKASVSTNDWIQVFGIEDGWILIQYAINKEHMRFGWISEEALSKTTVINELDFSPQRSTLLNTAMVTDDPLLSQSAFATLPQGATVYHLADMGDWAYIESASGDLLRGFVKSYLISLGIVYDLEDCPLNNGTPILSGTITIEQNNIEVEIAPLLFGTNQKIAVSGFKIYDNIAGNLLLTANATNASGQFVGNGTLAASTTSLRIAPLFSDNKEAGEEWSVILEW